MAVSEAGVVMKEIAVAASSFGKPIFEMVTSKQESAMLGCCRSEFETAARFYPSILSTRNRERHFACCCCESPWVETIAAWPKYKVLTVEFDEAINSPFFFAPLAALCPAATPSFAAAASRNGRLPLLDSRSQARISK